MKEQRKKRTVPAAAPAATPVSVPAAAAATEPSAPAAASVPIPLVPLTLSSVAPVAGGGGGGAAAAAAAPFQQKCTSIRLASCDGLYSDIRATVTQGTGAELAKKPSVSSVPKSKPRQTFLPEEVVSIIRDASKYMTQESFAVFKYDMNSKYSLGME